MSQMPLGITNMDQLGRGRLCSRYPSGLANVSTREIHHYFHYCFTG